MPATITPTTCRNLETEEGVCDCGDKATFRLPVVQQIAHDVLGLDESGGYVDLCGSCYRSDFLTAGYAAFVWEQIQRIDPDTGQPYPEGQDPHAETDRAYGIRG